MDIHTLDDKISALALALGEIDTHSPFNQAGGEALSRLYQMESRIEICAAATPPDYDIQLAAELQTVLQQVNQAMQEQLTDSNWLQQFPILADMNLLLSEGPNALRSTRGLPLHLLQDATLLLWSEESIGDGPIRVAGYIDPDPTTQRGLATEGIPMKGISGHTEQSVYAAIANAFNEMLYDLSPEQDFDLFIATPYSVQIDPELAAQLELGQRGFYFQHVIETLEANDAAIVVSNILLNHDLDVREAYLQQVDPDTDLQKIASQMRLYLGH